MVRPRPGRDASPRFWDATGWGVLGSSHGSLRTIGLAGLQHGVHDDGQLARDRHGGALEAEPLAQLQSPGSQVAVHLATRQENGRRLLEKPSHMGVSSPGDMPVIVDLARLIAPRRQPEPGGDGARRSEVGGILDRGHEGGRGDRPDPGDRHQPLAGLALPCTGQKLASELRCSTANRVPGLKQRKDDASQTVIA